MSQSEFYSTNLFRSFPLVTDNEQLFGLFADARVVVRPTIDYVHGRDRVVLTAYGTLSSIHAAILQMPAGPFVVFEVDNGQQLNLALIAAFGNRSTFEDVSMRLVPASELFAVLTGSRTAVVSPSQSKDLSGWCVLGAKESFSNSFVRTSAPLEPTCVFATPELSAGVNKTFVFNKRTTQYTQPAGCEHIDATVFVGDQYQQLCVTDAPNIKLVGGKQLRVNQRRDLSQLELVADGTPGEGGSICGSIDVAPEQDDTDTAPRCGEVLRTLNSLGGPSVSILGETGVSVQPHPELNRVVVDIGTKNLLLCIGANAEDEQVEYLPEDDQGQQCGDDNLPPVRPGVPDDSTGYAIIITPEPTDRATPTSNQRNRCSWQADNGDWELVNYPCKSPKSCSRPHRAPTSPNEVLFTWCLHVPFPTGEYIRNADFSNTDVALAGWDADGEVEVVSSFAGLPGSQFPMVKMVARDRSRVALSQTAIALVEGLYVFQVEAFLQTGTLTFMLIDSSTGQIQTQFQHSTTSSQPQQLVFGPFRIDAPSMTLRVEYAATPGSEALVGFFALVDQ